MSARWPFHALQGTCPFHSHNYQCPAVCGLADGPQRLYLMRARDHSRGNLATLYGCAAVIHVSSVGDGKGVDDVRGRHGGRTVAR